MAGSKGFRDVPAPRRRLRLIAAEDSHYALPYNLRDGRHPAGSEGSGPSRKAGAGEEGPGPRVPRHLINRFGIWHYYRRVPARFADVDDRTFVMVSLETRDLGRAERSAS